MNKKIISILLILITLVSIFATTCNAATVAKVFSNSKLSTYNDSAGYAKAGLTKLGYSVSTTTGPITKSSILNWIKGTSNGYAFYIHTLGGSGYFNDYNGNSIDKDDITGNWDLVYIDSSYSAKTDALARAFHTTGYSNRCFLGWSGSVTASNANQFNYYFWTKYIGGASIRACALAAADKVPGSGSTPTKLYGSTTYKGTAR